MPTRPVSHKLAFWCLILLFLVLMSSFVFKGSYKKSEDVLGVKWPEIKFTSSFSFNFENSDLANIIQSNLADQKGDYAVYIEEMGTGEHYGFADHDILPSASLYKLFLIAAVMKEVDSGNLKKDDRVQSSMAHLVEVFGGVDFGYDDKKDSVSYSVQEALERVGRISDNFAAIMLAEKIGWNNVQNMADSLHATSTTIKSPISTSAFDVGMFFKKLYKKEIVNVEVSDEIIKIIDLNQLNNRLPAKLPQEVKIIHKTGELSRVRHDGGIVYCCGGRDYVIVLMSKNLQYEDDGVELIAKISKDVYDYFSSK